MLKCNLRTILSIIAGSLPATPLSAQTLYNAGQLFYVSGNTPVTVQGSVQNTGTIINFGTITLSGDWNNQGSYNEGTGEISLNGSSAQSIAHKGQSFYQLTTDGSGEKILQEDATVTGKLTLQKGLLTPYADTKFLVAANAKTEGGSADSYVNGRLLQEGTGTKFFPIGKAGHYAPVTLVDITGITPVVGFEVFSPNPNTLLGPGLRQVSPARYWQKTMVSGTLTDAYIQLGFDAEDKLPLLNSVVIAEADGLNSPFRSLGQQTLTGDLTSGTALSKQSITGTVFAIGTGAEVTTMMAKVFIPNAFSPLSSHPEEKSLKVYGQLVPQDFLFRLYNRWGGLVFESRSLDEMQTEGWTGVNRTTGQEEALGVYTYTVQGKYEDGQSFKRAGTTTLVR